MQERKIYPSDSPEKQREYRKKYLLKHAEEHKERGRVWREANREYMREYGRRYRAEQKEKRRETRRKHYLANRDRCAADIAKRRAVKLKAIPGWANSFFIAEIYHLAELRSRLTGIKQNVDHIVPLQSKLVCGLHCESNLRVIPKATNLRKHNSYWPDMP